MYMIKNSKKIEGSSPEFYKHILIVGHMGGCFFYYSNLKGGPDVIDTELEEDLIKVESSPDVKVPYRNLPHFHLIHEDDLKALGCTRLLSLFHERIDNDILDFQERIDEDFHDHL
ncbi:hypothetical protein ES705_23664 [subsurface metagenome]|jgi:hypothetical protein